jgi:hypothetical protein
MELWQMDIVGGVLLDDGTECRVLTGVDDHSRVNPGRTNICSPDRTVVHGQGPPRS